MDEFFEEKEVDLKPLYKKYKDEELEDVLKNRLEGSFNKEDILDEETGEFVVEAEELIDNIVVSLGGAENIENIDACITRLRVTVKDASIVADDARWKELQAKGVIRSGKGIQVVYGTQAETYKNQIREKYRI